MNKKMLAIFLSTTLTLSLLPTSAFADADIVTSPSVVSTEIMPSELATGSVAESTDIKDNEPKPNAKEDQPTEPDKENEPEANPEKPDKENKPETNPEEPDKENKPEANPEEPDKENKPEANPEEPLAELPVEPEESIEEVIPAEELEAEPKEVQSFLEAVDGLDSEDSSTIEAALEAYKSLTREQQEQEDVIVAYTVLMEFIDTVSILSVAENTIYVSEDGNDEQNDGSSEKPFATLTKAVESAPDNATIHIMSDLEMKSSARFWNKNLTITSDANGLYTLKRAKDFSAASDPARKSYNPAMIEVNGSLRLENIILDDCGEKVGQYFAQAGSNGTGKTELDKGNIVSNQDIVQDGIISAYDGKATIILGNGTKLRNFGGMSAVRVTGGSSKLIMESGSIIEDTIEQTRQKGEPGSFGPAGAIWSQGAKVIMEEGSSIQNVNGRAIYMDSGEVDMGGTIKGIKSNKNMWNGDAGTAIHLRSNASCEMSGTATGCTGGIMISLLGNEFILTESGKLLDSEKATGIWTGSDFQDKITIHGEIARLKGNINPIQGNTVDLVIGKTAKIHDNEVYYGALYLQSAVNADIYGKIYNNNASGRGGGIGNAGHGRVIINLYDGAEIKDNSAIKSGGGLSIKNCTFNMYGGEISGNSTDGPGGGIFMYKDSVQANLYDGTIVNNNEHKKSNDITITSAEYGTTQRYLYVSDKINIGNPAIRMEANAKTITLHEDSLNTKLHNASSNSVNTLTTAASDKGWAKPAATFWTQRDGAASMTIGGLSLNIDLPVYVLTQKVGEDGLPVEEAAVKVYAGSLDNGNVQITLPEEDVWDNGCAAAIVQPTKDYGSVTITGPTEVAEDKETTEYKIPYTATYNLSESLKNILLNPKDITNDPFKFVMKLDERLTADEEVHSFSSPIFDVASVDAKDNILTVTCKLNDDWEQHLADGTLTTFAFTGTLPADEYGGVLETTGEVHIQLSPVDSIIPANICLTKLTPVAETSLTIKPVDLVKYITMDHFHEDHINCFPDPRYEGIPDHAEITVNDVEWESSDLSGSSYPFTINYYESDGKTLIINDHDPGTYIAKIEVLPEVRASLAQIKINGKPLKYESGILTMREVVGINETFDTEDISSSIQQTVPTELQDKAVAVMPENMTYWVNNIEDCYPTGNDIRLLQDELLPAPAGEEEDIYVQMMIDRLEKFETDLKKNNRRYAMKYLDLIDAGDSNVLVCAQKPYWIYIPYPAGTNQNTEFRLFHFDGLDRTYTEQDYGPNVSDNILNSVVREFRVEKVEEGIAFEVHPPKDNRQNYSIGAMALTWKVDSGSSGSGSSGGGNHSTKHYTLSYDSNGGTKYKDEVYRRNTTVELDKLPNREGYTFTGWYADEGLKDKITEIKMTSNKTVYAGWQSELEFDALNSKDHIAYVSGYPDGTVKPNAQITRAQTAAMLYRLLTDTKRQEIESDINRFIDLKDTDWFYHSVTTMANGNYISGYPDGTFKGNNTITRAEFVTMLVRFIGLKDAECKFPDVPDNHWANDFIATATAAGWISGYEDGTFAPDKNITRAEAMAIINRVLDRGINAESELPSYKKFPDNHKSAWYFYEVIEATNSHKYTGSRPTEDWTSLN